MKLRAALVLLLLATGPALGQPLHLGPSPPLPSLATLPRIRVEVGRDEVTVTEDVNLPRGQWAGGDLDLFAAFGSPGTPRAVDARVYALTEGALDPAADAVGESLVIDMAPRRPSTARQLLGSPQMAGFVVHLREAVFRRAVASGGTARIRVRSLLELPGEDARGGRELVIRLGVQGGGPVALGTIELVSPEARGAMRAEAHLCGPEADPYPLAVALVPRPAPSPAPSWPGPAAPSMTVRHASDDLCLRFWRP